MNDIIHKFDQTTKLTIHSADEPVYITIGNIRYNNPEFNIKRGALKLSGKEATSLFDESIKAIIDAFDQQRKAATIKITTAFLVGGLGTNDFVWTHLQSHLKAQGINICRPDNDINKAVANGAVIFHIDRVVKSRVARATYGIRYAPWVDESNPEHTRRKNQWEINPSGSYTVKGGFFPILRKGDQVDQEKEIRHPFCFTHQNRTDFGSEQVEIMCYRGNLPNPQWLDEDSSSFAKLCTIRADLSKAANTLVAETVSGEVYHRIHFDVVAFFGATELTAQMAWKENKATKGDGERMPRKKAEREYERYETRPSSSSSVQYQIVSEERTPAKIVYYDY